MLTDEEGDRQSQSIKLTLRINLSDTAELFEALSASSHASKPSPVYQSVSQTTLNERHEEIARVISISIHHSYLVGPLIG